ncbi:MAG: DUF2934 domain-containing protein [Pseudomonadota bacterium]
MTAAQMHRSRDIARNAPHATRRKTKPKRVVGTIHQKTAKPRSEFSDEEWQETVATAAYHRAEARGFNEGSPEGDWYEAEAELRAQLARAEEGTESVPDSGASPADIEREGE